MVNEDAQQLEEFTYESSDVVIRREGADERLEIGAEACEFGRDPDTGGYTSSEAPYRAFGSLDELARAVIDARAEEAG